MANINIPDSALFQAGAGPDLKITHDGSNSTISNATGTLTINNIANSSMILGTNNTTAVTIDNGQNVTMVGDLKLPQSNDAASPSLKFGDGDTGFYESGDDTIQISIAGTAEYLIDAYDIRSNTASSFILDKLASSSTNPTYTFNGDTDTGLGRAEANELSLTTGGAERVRIDSAGNVGIGVTPETWNSTASALQLGGTGAFYSPTSQAAGGAVNILQNAYWDNTDNRLEYIVTDEATRYYQADGTHVFLVAASGLADSAISFTTAMTIDNAGNVGIGTAAPANNLDISAASPIIRLTDTDVTNLNHRITGGGSKGLEIAADVQNVAADSYIRFDVDGTEKVRIDGSGNVGIGTTTPDRLLDVSGTGNVYGKFQSTNATGAGIEVKDTEEDWIIQADGGYDALAFYDLGRSAYRMVIDGSGKVGIGTTAPNAPLDVRRNESETYVAEFFHDGGSVDRWGIMVQAGHDTETGSNYFFIAKDGDGGATGYLKTVSGTFQLSDTSDIRLKENIKDTTLKGIETVDKIKVRDYNWKKNKDNVVIGGFIANELQEVYPQAVDGKPDAVDKDGEIDPMTVSRDVLVPLLVKAVQELSAKVEALESA